MWENFDTKLMLEGVNDWNCHEIPLLSCITETFLSYFKNSKLKLKENLDIFWNDEVNCKKIGKIYSMPNVLNCVHWITVQFKGQLISKANSKLFIWTKNQRKLFCISALASISGRIKKNIV